VTVEGFKMYFRSTRAGTPEYHVRLMELAGSNLVWSVRDCQYGCSHRQRGELCLARAVAS
jgi:hypothetical protein